MSFICSQCHNPAPRGVSPFIDMTQVAKTYFDAKKQVIGTGSEIVSEAKLCPTCTGIKLTPTAQTDASTEKVFATGFAKSHVRRCEGFKKVTKDGETLMIPCKVCEDIKRTFAAIPSQILTSVIEEPKGQPASFSLGLLLVEALNTQSKRRGRRSHRDFAAGYRVLKEYEQRGGGI